MAQNINNDEERLLLKKAEDKFKICEKRYAVTNTGFLNEREQDILLGRFGECGDIKAVFSGGYPDAERRMLIFVPQYEELDESELMAAVRCSYYKDYALSHRDFLGSLMALGIERETVGDIITDKENCCADIVLKREILGFVMSELVSAGRAKLNVRNIGLNEISALKKETEIVTDTVASPRIDAVVASGFGMSRESSALLVKSGKVYVDRRMTAECSKTVNDGALINAVGYGKFRVFISDTVSRKGRIFIKIEKYK